MKKFFVLLSVVFVHALCFAQTININWKVGDTTYATNTCEYGGTLTVPSTPPTKYGYTFQGWGTYFPIEYIEFTGTQYIDTGLKADLNTKIELRFSVDVSTPRDNVQIFGASEHTDNTKSFYIATKTGDLLYAQFDSVIRTIVQEPTYTVGMPTTTVLDKNGWYQDSVLSATYTGATNFITPSNLLIGKVNGRTLSSLFIGKFYFVKIYDNGTLVRNMIPAKRNSDSAIGMYDRVTGTFFVNAGTGEFIAGPAK